MTFWTGVWKFVSGFFGLILKNFKISFTLILLLVLFFSAVSESVKQKSPEPIVKILGNEVLAYDNSLKIHTQEILGGKGSFNAWLLLIFSLWFYYIFIYIFFRIFGVFNVSEKLQHIFFALLFVSVLQIGTNYVIYNKLIWPFAGLIYFIIHLPDLLNPIIKNIPAPSKELGNISNVTLPK